MKNEKFELLMGKIHVVNVVVANYTYMSNLNFLLEYCEYNLYYLVTNHGN